MKKISKSTAVLAVFAMLLCAVPFSAFADEQSEKSLQFHNGEFKILILSDLQDTNKPQKETLDLMEAAINETNPDFIVLNGDNTAGWWAGVDKEETEAAVENISSRLSIPFALVFGNHDHEGLANDKNGMTEEEAKEFLLSCFQKNPYCMAIEGEEMTGVGNYNLLIKDSTGEKDIFNLWFMDSNPYTPEEEGGGYGYVHEDQTEWYKNTSDKLKADNGGNIIPSILFQHIIVPEAYDMFTTVEKGTSGAVRGHGSFSDNYYIVNDEYIYQGSLNEGPCPPDVNHGQFDSWIEQGDIIGAFFGHDHVNDFAGSYRGIKLVATPAAGYYSYGNHHGVRTITLSEDNLTDFESEILLFDDLVDYKIINTYKANHGYFEYISVFVPAVVGSIAGVAVLAAVIIIINKVIKKRKKA